jgi:hypothetical protein
VRRSKGGLVASKALGIGIPWPNGDEPRIGRRSPEYIQGADYRRRQTAHANISG